ncbi:MAG: endonuclease, partial [Clostridia bacterium]|nr:endonuclease [Clostridia bacterium]
MKKLAKIGLVLSLFATASMPAFAQNNEKTASAAIWKGAATGYTKASDVDYVTSGKYIANWGARDEACVFLTSYANNFYTGSYTYEQLSLKAGSTNTSNVTSSALFNALNDLVTSKQTYQTSYNATRDLFCYTDCVNGNYSNISSFYSGTKLSGDWDSGATWNREHTWPNSKGDANGNGENDIMMLRPTATSENGSRGNTAYGQSSKYYDPNCEGQNVRGDCARIFLYVYTRWGKTNTTVWGSSGVMESKEVLLKWMEEDPVDTWEMGRNDATQAITGTRNVYVDYPELAWQLFGQTAPTDMVTPSGKASNGTATPTPTPTPDPEPDTPDTPDTPTTPSVTSGLEEGVAYTVSARNANDLLYLTSSITSGRFDCTTNAANAVQVYVENVSGGQRLYMLNGTTKTYFVFADKAAGGSTTTDASSATVFEWNSDLNTLVVADDSNNRAFGAGNTSTYESFSAYDASNSGYNWGQFAAVGGTQQPDTPDTPVEPDTPVQPDPDTPDVPTQPSEPVTSGLEEGVAYTVSASNTNGVLYLTSSITSGRFDCTTNSAEAVYVYVENVSGGQLLY